MTGLGTILNTACILLGGLAGLFLYRNISTKTQQNLKLAIALVSLAIGFMMIWDGLVGSYPGQASRGWLMRFYLFIVVMISLSAGKWLGGKSASNGGSTRWALGREKSSPPPRKKRTKNIRQARASSPAHCCFAWGRCRFSDRYKTDSPAK